MQEPAAGWLVSQTGAHQDVAIVRFQDAKLAPSPAHIRWLHQFGTQLRGSEFAGTAVTPRTRTVVHFRGFEAELPSYVQVAGNLHATMSAEALSLLPQGCLLRQALLQELDEALRLRGQQACLGERIDRRRLALPGKQYPAQASGCHVVGGDLFGK